MTNSRNTRVLGSVTTLKRLGVSQLVLMTEQNGTADALLASPNACQWSMFRRMVESGHSRQYPDFMSNVTQILSLIEDGDASASEQLLPLVYQELRRLAAQKMALEKQGQTLQATALVHEAYVRLVDGEHQQRWDSRGHFFAAAAEAMRRILVDRARHKQSQKLGGDRKRIELNESELADESKADHLLAINDALDELQQHDSQAAELIKLRFFAGFGHQEAAEMLGISRRTADGVWAAARAWIYARINEE